MANHSLLKSDDRFAALPRRTADGTAKRKPVTTGDHGVKFHARRQTLPCLNVESNALETGSYFLAGV